MNNVILFDMDSTLFDPKRFLEGFYNRLSEKFKLINFDENTLKYTYLESKIDGFFNPEIFLAKILEHINQKDKEKLTELFWNRKELEKCFFQDSTIVEAVSKLAVAAIFSSGDNKFQNLKTENFLNFVKKENIFIYKDKMEHLEEVLSKFKDYKVFMIDDRIELLEETKSKNPHVFTVLINRLGRLGLKNGKIDAIVANLYEILPFLNE